MRDDFLKTLDVALNSRPTTTPEWCAAYERLRQYQVGWHRTLWRYVGVALVVCGFAGYGVARFFQAGGEDTSSAVTVCMLLGSVVARNIAWASYERATGIPERDFQDAERCLTIYRHDAKRYGGKTGAN